jgi:hypothetical protein
MSAEKSSRRSADATVTPSTSRRVTEEKTVSMPAASPASRSNIVTFNWAAARFISARRRGVTGSRALTRTRIRWRFGTTSLSSSTS